MALDLHFRGAPSQLGVLSDGCASDPSTIRGPRVVDRCNLGTRRRLSMDGPAYFVLWTGRGAGRTAPLGYEPVAPTVGALHPPIGSSLDGRRDGPPPVDIVIGVPFGRNRVGDSTVYKRRASVRVVLRLDERQEWLLPFVSPAVACGITFELASRSGRPLRTPVLE